MNAYTTRGQARIQQQDISNVLDSHGYRAGAVLALLERTRGWQAEAEVNWLLKQHDAAPRSTASFVSVLRQAIGTALVRTGEGIMGASCGSISPATADVAGMVGAAH